MIDLLRGRRWQHAAALLVLGLVFGITYLHARYGYLSRDEGWYLATALRYALGDMPYRDELSNATRASDVLFSQVFALHPQLTVFQARLCGAAFNLAGFAAVYAFFARLAPPALVALACAICFFGDKTIVLLTPGYDLGGSTLLMAAGTLWLGTLIRRVRWRRAHALAAGAVLGLAIIAYIPAVCLVGVPLVFLLWAYRTPARRAAVADGAALLAGGALSIGIWVGLMIWHGVLGDFVKALLFVFELSDAFAKHGYEWGEVPTRTGPKIGLLLTQFFTLSLDRTTLLVYLTAGLQGLTALLYWRQGPGGRRAMFRLWVAASAWGWGCGAVWGYFSTLSLQKVPLGLQLAFVANVAALYRLVKSGGFPGAAWFARSLPAARLVAAALVPPLLVTGYCFYYTVYWDAEPRELTAPFQHPKLKGLYSTPAKVRALDRTLAYLGDELGEQDYLLAYYTLPGFYYYTHKLPAYRIAWIDNRWAPSSRKLVFDMSQADGRRADYCVRMLSDPYTTDWGPTMPIEEDAPLDTYVRENYYLEEINHPFEILRRGPGPKLRLLQTRPPLFAEGDFWPGGTVDGPGLEAGATHLTLLEPGAGEVSFARLEEGGAPYLRAFVPPGAAGPDSMRFGYRVGHKGFAPGWRPGDSMLLAVTARAADGHADGRLFIADRTAAGTETHEVAVHHSEWTQYIVEKEYRQGAGQVQLGFIFLPRGAGDWLEVKEIKMYRKSARGL